MYGFGPPFDEEQKKVEVPGYERLLLPVAQEQPATGREHEFAEAVAGHR
jgi:hypothetical protein